ncbi:MAG: MFS transporter [Dehalococcoidia bacterium]|nr:MFS transporter [Dehalococcoidia bacterium]
MDDDPIKAKPGAARRVQPWTISLALFAITSMVETLGVSQISAFMPIYLQEMGLPNDAVPHWVGVMNSLIFVLGLPLVPLWGVWADKYSRKAVIVRSALVEAMVFGLVALSRQPWQLAGSLLLVGFQLGNTGVMLSALRDVTPRGRLGTAIAFFGASSPIGFAVGPALGGFMIDHLHTSISAVYALSAAFSLGTALMLALGWREVRPKVAPTGRVLALAYGAMRGVLTDQTTRRLFTIFGIAFLARQMASPFMPLLVQHLNASDIGLASAVALVVGTAALIGGLISPLAGTLGDRIGFRPVLAAALVGGSVALLFMPFETSVPWLAVNNVAYAALNASITAMIFGMLASEVPSERSSATLNLVYLPLYIAGIVGPAIGAVVVAAGVPAPFELSGLLLALGAVFTVTRLRKGTKDSS